MTFIVAVATPKAVATSSVLLVHARRQGRLRATSTAAPTTRRPQATVMEGMSENRETASPAPRYWDREEATKINGAGSRSAVERPPALTRARIPGSLRVEALDSWLITPTLSGSGRQRAKPQPASARPRLHPSAAAAIRTMGTNPAVVISTASRASGLAAP